MGVLDNFMETWKKEKPGFESLTKKGNIFSCKSSLLSVVYRLLKV